MALLQYDFRVINENAIHAALGSIERRVAQHNARMRTAFGGTPVARAGRTVTTTGRTVADRIVREEEKAANKATLYWQKAAQRAADFRIREEERANRAIQRGHERTIRKAEAEGRRLGGAQFRASQAFARRERAERVTASRAIVGGIGRSAVGALGAVGSYAGAALGIAGGFAAGSALQTQVSESSRAARLANSAGAPQIKGDLLRQAQGVKGFTGGEALAGLESFVEKTGDLESARGLLGDLSQLALATGSDLGDLGATAGQAFNVLRKQIDDPVLRMKEMRGVMRTLAAQGRMGAVEVRDLATEFGKLGAATLAFEGGSPDLLKQMGAFAQIAIASGGANSSADAATAASRLASDIVTNRKRFKNLGVDIQSKKDPTKLRNSADIMLDVLDATGGDVTKTAGLFGQESVKIFRGLSSTYSAAETKEKGSGRKAVEAELKGFAAATLTDSEISQQAGSMLAEPELQFKEAMKEFNAAIGKELLPVLTRLVPEFTALVPSAAKAARVFGVIAENLARDPISGIGHIIAAKIAVDLAGAGIGAAAKKAFEASLSSGLSGALGKGGLVIGTIVGAIELAQLTVKMLEMEGETAAKAATAGANEVRERAKSELLTTGTLSEATRAELMKLQETEQSTLAKGRSALKEYDTGDFIRRGFNQIFGTGDGEDLSQLSRLGAAASSDEYVRGASDTKQLIDIANIKGLSPESIKEMTQMLTAAGEDFAKSVATAGEKLALNRGNGPTTPVP